MEYWEFLLQKEGDQSWLPLDASQVEILEGRYRVMAHTSQVNTPVHIHISQMLRDRPAAGTSPPGAGVKPVSDGGGSPQRRTLRRQDQTSPSGLMVVVPFTRLGEGTWDILCTRANPDELALDFADPADPKDVSLTWRYGVQLQVVSQDFADDGDWFADDDSAGLVETMTAAQPNGTVSDTSELVAGLSPLDLQATAAAMDEFQSQLTDGLVEGALPYGLTLSQTALLGNEGEALGLSATVTGPPEGESYPPLTLVGRLSDPQTASSVALTSTPLATATLPASLTLAMMVPAGLSTRLLLGEVGLLAGAEVVALQQFTVTVDVASLFNAIANQAEAKTELGVVFPADDLEVEADTAALNSTLKSWDIDHTPPPRAMPILTLPRSSPALPPKIYYPSPHEASVHRPALPPMGGSKRPSPSVPRTDAGADPGSGPDSSPEPGRGLSLPPLAPPSQADDPLAILSRRSPDSAGSPKPPSPSPQLISREAMGFKDLKLQDRFWNRLNELAVNLQQDAVENRAAADQAEAEAAALPNVTVPNATVEFIPFAGEVVIYEDEDPTLRDLSQASSVVPMANPAIAPEVVTPPVPDLVVPEGDLIAGEPVLVTLRVPFHPNRLYLKVWITDPQTRTLVDEPRQLMNLLPNGRDQLEGSLQLTAPLGCLEAWFEAIAVDMVTQQESYKTTVSRTITPAGLPPSSLDEFQL
jgi:hypothetical protein